jgi:hypothetical protein
MPWLLWANMRKGGNLMQANIGTTLQWLQLIITVIGLLTVFIRIGNTQGQQEIKNKNFEAQGVKIEGIEKDISEIKTDVAYIKGKLL